MNNIFVLKVGGSILSPDPDHIFHFENARKLYSVLKPHIANGSKFILCVGGGYLGRSYQKMLREEGFGVTQEHKIGVASINMNAEMLFNVVEEDANPEIIRYKDFDLDTQIKLEKGILVSAAGSPGHSSDWNTVKLALRTGAKSILSLKNIDGVYTADPRKVPEAKRIDSLTWDEYLKVIGNPVEHVPGANYPVDPLASNLSKDNGLSFYIIKGDDWSNLENVLNGSSFNGTKIGNSIA